MAELVTDLRDDQSGAGPQPQRFIYQLNRDFGILREILQTSEPVSRSAPDRSARQRRKA
jgi:hypothetical protein